MGELPMEILLNDDKIIANLHHGLSKQRGFEPVYVEATLWLSVPKIDLSVKIHTKDEETGSISAKTITLYGIDTGIDTTWTIQNVKNELMRKERMQFEDYNRLLFAGKELTDDDQRLYSILFNPA